MPSEFSVIIREFNKRDRQEVRNIAYDTAFIGKPAPAFFEGKEIVCDALVLYFTDYEPQSCFVAETNGRVAGYLVGAKNKADSEKIIMNKIAPRLLRDALLTGVLLRKKNIIFIFNLLSAIIKGEFKMPDFTQRYPAAFHINIDRGYRGLNIGSRLVATYLDYLTKEKIAGVHLATLSSGAGEFFSRQGFELLHSGKRSYFRHILHEDAPLYIYGKRL